MASKLIYSKPSSYCPAVTGGKGDRYIFSRQFETLIVPVPFFVGRLKRGRSFTRRTTYQRARGTVNIPMMKPPPSNQKSIIPRRGFVSNSEEAPMPIAKAA